MLILFFFVSFPPVLPRYRFFFNPINYFLLFLQFFSVFFLEKINCLLFFKKLFNNNNYNFQYDYLILSANNFKIIQPTLSDFTLRDLAPLILAVRATPLSSTESSPQKIDFNQVPSSTLKKSQNECSWTNLTNNAHIEPGNVIYKEVTINNINYRVDDKLLNDDNEKIFSQFKTTPNLFTKIEKNFIPQTDNEYNSNTYENNGSGSVADGYTPKDSQTISNDSGSSNSMNSGNFSTKKESSNNFNNDDNGDDNNDNNDGFNDSSKKDHDDSEYWKNYKKEFIRKIVNKFEPLHKINEGITRTVKTGRPATPAESPTFFRLALIPFMFIGIIATYGVRHRAVLRRLQIMRGTHWSILMFISPFTSNWVRGLINQALMPQTHALRTITTVVKNTFEAAAKKEIEKKTTEYLNKTFPNFFKSFKK